MYEARGDKAIILLIFIDGVRVEDPLFKNIIVLPSIEAGEYCNDDED